jgi:uncharacterized RDD family membrane protein YckC
MSSLSSATASPLDTSIALVTPERITFRYPLAGPFRRSLSYLIDVLVWFSLMALVLLVCVLASFVASTAVITIFLLVWFFMQWGYGAALETLWNGQTIGKKALSIRVLSTDGTPITGGQALLRNFTWTFEGVLPLLYLPAVVSCAATRRYQRLGDLLARTMVVIEQRPTRGSFPKFDNREILALARQLPVRFPAGPELSRALADYVRNRARWSTERREEMAAYLANPIRKLYALPDSANADAILCAAYQKVFHGA